MLKNCEEGSDRMLIFLSCMLLLLSNTGVLKGRGMRWVERVEHMGGENCVQSLVGKPEEKGPFGRSRRRWECNVKMYAKWVGSVDLICVA
jgi:hypothetical protein